MIAKVETVVAPQDGSIVLSAMFELIGAFNDLPDLGVDVTDACVFEPWTDSRVSSEIRSERIAFFCRIAGQRKFS